MPGALELPRVLAAWLGANLELAGPIIRFGSVRYGSAHRDVVLGGACSRLLRRGLLLGGPAHERVGAGRQRASDHPAPQTATPEGYRCPRGTYRSRAAVAAAR